VDRHANIVEWGRGSRVHGGPVPRPLLMISNISKTAVGTYAVGEGWKVVPLKGSAPCEQLKQYCTHTTGFGHRVSRDVSPSQGKWKRTDAHTDTCMHTHTKGKQRARTAP
jgi:hypothetical protein